MILIVDVMLFHFLFQDLHVLDLEHFSYGGASITWAQLVYKISDHNMGAGVRNYDSFLRLRGLHPVPKHYFTVSFNILFTFINHFKYHSVGLAHVIVYFYFSH